MDEKEKISSEEWDQIISHYSDILTDTLSEEVDPFEPHTDEYLYSADPNFDFAPEEHQ